MRRRNLKQPWLFLYLAVGFGLLNFFFSHESLPLAIFGGLLFACLMTVFMPLYLRWKSARKGRPSRFES